MSKKTDLAKNKDQTYKLYQVIYELRFREGLVLNDALINQIVESLETYWK